MKQLPNYTIVYQNRTYRPAKEQKPGSCEGCAMYSGPNSEITTACPEFIRRQMRDLTEHPCDTWIFHAGSNPTDVATA